MATITDRLAAAPISWGVCEAEGWGHQLSPQRVLGEMAELGIRATELGPLGFLPVDPQDRLQALEHYGLKAVGGFLPVVLHDQHHDPMPAVEAELQAFEVTGAQVLVLSADTGAVSYDQKQQMDDQQWAVLGDNLHKIATKSADRGITAVLHPHVGTMIESAAAVERLLEETSVDLCLDTGHLLIGGTNPLGLVRQHAPRVGHVHLKDVDAQLAAQVRRGELEFTTGVRQGMFVPLGAGDCGIPEIIAELEASDYRGWYVLEQDTMLSGPPHGPGPMADVRASAKFLQALLHTSVSSH
ncbi:TIM barrel protein [Kocuria sediminis]|uniref:TIM barrel protein n=1 Tax=Kocuria sediminis TaxID=1038857 RepID=A0A6N8GRH6_9MICC|nr:TIM barrel protein [Kocuria sediminis]MUN64782.1 TIM barrel protein [Kocuria sediminis]